MLQLKFKATVNFSNSFFLFILKNLNLQDEFIHGFQGIKPQMLSAWAKCLNCKC